MSEERDDEVLGKAYDARLARRLWAYVRPYHALVAGSLVLVLAVSAVQLVQPWIVKQAIDGSIARRTLVGLGGFAALYLLTLVTEFLLRYAQLYILEKTGQNVVFDLRCAVFAHLQSLPSSFFDRNPIGRLMTRVTTDVEAINEAFGSGVVLILADLLKLAAIVAILLAMDLPLALVTLAVIPPMLGVSAWFRSRVRTAWREIRTLVARLNAFLQESVSGMRLIQLFVRERENEAAFDEVNRGHLRAQLRGVWYDSAFSAVAELMGALTLAAIVWAGGRRILGQAITFGTLVAFIQYAERFFGPVQELSQRYTVMQAAMASAERIFGLLDTPVTIASPPVPVAMPARPRGEVAFENVTFSYLPGQPVLQGVSFRIAPGERVGVVGWTGSGKSTLIRLLVRLYDVDSGRITLDGRDVRDYAIPDLRRAVGVVLQDPFLFADTVEANVSLGDPRVDPDRVRRAAALVRVDRIVERLPGGWAEPVRERGSNFSVGERQLLSFARALAFDPAVLVLDEATASVDPETEGKIQAALQTVLSGRTSILIAHRLSTLREVDRILVLHHGVLREQGTHEELLRLDGGIYRTLHDLQGAGRATI